MKKQFTPAPVRSRLAVALGALTLCGALLGGASAQAQTIKIEAEAGALAGTAAFDNAITPYSGTGYVKFDQTGTLTLTVPVTTAGTYDMIVRYNSPYDFKLVDMRVNGTAADPNQSRYLNSTLTSGGFKSTTASRYNLTAGNNTVVFTASYGYHGIDYIQFTKSSATVTALTPSATGRVEAEAGIITGAQSYLKDGGSGQSGNLFVGNFFLPTDNVSLAVTVATAGQYELFVGAREDGVGKAFTLGVNGAAAVSVPIPNTGNGSSATTPFVRVSAGIFALTAGTNTIVLGGSGGYFDLDYLDLVRSTATAVKVGTNGMGSITAFPNPATTGQLNVALEVTASQQAEVALVNAVGQRVLARTQALKAGQNQFSLPTANLANGMYQLVIYVNNQPSASVRVVLAE